MVRHLIAKAVIFALLAGCSSDGVSVTMSDNNSSRSKTSAPTDEPESGSGSTEPDALPTLDRTVIGESVQGRPIEVWHRVDTRAATMAIDDPQHIVVLVIGSIHGNEPAGLDIVDVLAEMPVSEIDRVELDGIENDQHGSIDLWLMPTGNPDGIAAGTRHNARQVDLNRNFPLDWAPLQRPGDYEYAGTGAASEPETRAMMTFIDELRPDLTVWFHQDAYRVAPSWRKDQKVRELYAYLTGLPLLAVEGGTYTGVAATWHRRTLNAVSFIVELGKTLSGDEAQMHARAVLAVTSALPT